MVVVGSTKPAASINLGGAYDKDVYALELVTAKYVRTLLEQYTIVDYQLSFTLSEATLPDEIVSLVLSLGCPSSRLTRSSKRTRETRSPSPT